MLCRFPDLYDYGERDNDFEESSGLGYYCLMSAGNHLGNGKSPSPISAYLRDLVKWCDNVVNLNNPGTYQANYGDYGTVLRYSTDKSNEYFLVENRHKEGLDLDLPDKGLAVYHCDTRGSNEYQGGTPDRHFQCALIQADGHLDMEHNLNGGDDGDLFDNVQGIALSDTTTPHSREWDGTDSGLLISNIGASGSIIPFRTGSIPVPNSIEQKVVVDKIIPDNDPVGICSEILVDAKRTLNAISIDVKITHASRGNLKVILSAPSGDMVILHNKKGGKHDNLELHLNSNTFKPLAELKGKSIEGKWKLTVCDLKKGDIGRLDSWGLKIDFDNKDELVTAEAIPNIVIPDFNMTGVQSTVKIEKSGKLKGISVEVDITHTHTGDIWFELISPAGQHVLLKSSTGLSGTNILETYSEVKTPNLKVLINKEIKGNWILHVCDVAGMDVGTLNRWGLKILT